MKNFGRSIAIVLLIAIMLLPTACHRERTQASIFMSAVENVEANDSSSHETESTDDADNSDVEASVPEAPSYSAPQATTSRPSTPQSPTEQPDSSVVQPPTSTECTNHSFGSYTVTKPATCTAVGEQVRECTKCGATETKTVAILNHKLGEWTIAKPATCGADGQKERSCSNCTYKETDTVSATGNHSYGSWSTVSNATCSSQGEKKRVCSVCGDTEHDYISATGQHTYSGGKCSACGYYRQGSSCLQYVLSNDGTYYIASGSTSILVNELVVPGWYNGKPVKEISGNLTCSPRTLIVCEGVERINGGAFTGARLTSVTLPDSLNYIGRMAFGGCSSLADVYVSTSGWKSYNPFLSKPSKTSVDFSVSYQVAALLRGSGDQDAYVRE